MRYSYEGALMNTVTDRKPVAADREAEKGRVALKAFFRITDEWGCTGEDQRKLLGNIGKTTLQKYKQLPPVRLSQDTMERISYIIGIYKAVQMLYPTPERANRRMMLTTTEAPFGGVSALEFMKRSQMKHLMLTRQYFDAKRGW